MKHRRITGSGCVATCTAVAIIMQQAVARDSGVGFARDSWPRRAQAYLVRHDEEVRDARVYAQPQEMKVGDDYGF